MMETGELILGSIFNKIKKILPSRKSPKDLQIANDKGEREACPLSSNLDKNIKHIRAIFDRCDDITMREFKIGAKTPIRAFMVHIEGMIDTSLATNNISKKYRIESPFN